jgi:cation transport regulator
MPYEDVKDLPDSVQNHLPVHAQEIYRAAFNSAFEEYHRDESRAHQIAWAAVKKKYKKDEKTGLWKPI